MEKAIEIIRHYEGLRLRAYRCPSGKLTIGWGHTRGVKPRDVITEAQAEALLREDVAAVNARLDYLMGNAGLWLCTNKREALVSFMFNVGYSAFHRSTLWRKVVRNPSDSSIFEEFKRWKYAGGVVMPGLLRRRISEAQLFFRDC